MNRFKFMLFVCGAVFVASATKLWLQRSAAMSLFEAPLGGTDRDSVEISTALIDQ